MGLTSGSVGRRGVEEKRSETALPRVAFLGNPNVGKSSLFNGLTGLNQHTGNWTGKTVAIAEGRVNTEKGEFEAVDLPGTYSLHAASPEEEIAGNYLLFECPRLCLVVLDGTGIARGLPLVLRTMELTSSVAVCINLMDEAERKGIIIDTRRLSELLGVPVMTASARDKKSIHRLGLQICELVNAAESIREDGAERAVREEKGVCDLVSEAERIAAETVTESRGEGTYGRADRRADKLLTGRLLGYPMMILLLLITFWITIVGANYPSEWLSWLFSWVGDRIGSLFDMMKAPLWLKGLLIDGAYNTLAFVVSVMLPPMAIFFPLFTILEDIGYLPRIAYNLDSPFRRCGSCGKQALTMCMGFGCNAAGVVGCRIISSPRERYLAMITNSLVPCNGRFPTLITLITMFCVFSRGASPVAHLLPASILTGIIILGVIMTLLVTRILSATVFKGVPSSFVLELPPYRPPKIGSVIVRSMLDRTLFVLGRAAAVAAPVGALIWCLANIRLGGESLFALCAEFADPIAFLLGFDGVVLMAFLLGFPANEIVLPIAVMAYASAGSISQLGALPEVKELLVSNGWTVATAISVILFSLFHWPCSTTVMTIKKETNSTPMAILSVIIPTALGAAVCILFNLILRLFS